MYASLESLCRTDTHTGPAASIPARTQHDLFVYYPPPRLALNGILQQKPNPSYLVYCFSMDTVLVDSGFFSSLRSIVDSIQSFRMTKVDWTLSLCCGTQEVIFCVLCGCYLIINYFLWNVFLVKPMKLIAVFVHEMGHGKRKPRYLNSSKTI